MNTRLWQSTTFISELKASKLHIIILSVGKPPVNYNRKGPVILKIFTCHDVITQKHVNSNVWRFHSAQTHTVNWTCPDVIHEIFIVGYIQQLKLLCKRVKYSPIDPFIPPNVASCIVLNLPPPKKECINTDKMHILFFYAFQFYSNTNISEVWDQIRPGYRSSYIR